MTSPDIERLETPLDDFDPEVRRHALRQLQQAAASGHLDAAPRRGAVNMHGHTFFSFNGYGYSPSHFVWRAWREGLSAVGICDFDTLDGLDETLEASDLVGLPATVGLETRVYFPEYGDVVINSPGEPGIVYFMGVGFTERPDPGSPAGQTLAGMARAARERNEAMVKRINAFATEIAIDYARDVLPLTPAGNATERHLLEAYTRKAEAVFRGRPDEAVDYWTCVLGVLRTEVLEVFDDTPAFHDLIRKALMKQGGVGYAAPEANSFPALSEVVRMARDAGAIPCATWLDGTSAGERDFPRMIDLLMAQGIGALNVIPDRNWNVPDIEKRETLKANLDAVVTLARTLHLPLNVGTELNKYGQKFVDTFDHPDMQPWRDDFLRGAAIVYGHTLIRRREGWGYMDEEADRRFGDDRKAKNDFFAERGKAVFGG